MNCDIDRFIADIETAIYQQQEAIRQMREGIAIGEANIAEWKKRLEDLKEMKNVP